MKKYIIILFLLSLTLSAQAQKVRPVTIDKANRATISVVFHDADEVEIYGSCIIKRKNFWSQINPLPFKGKPHADMQQVNDSLWTYTTDVLPSELYTYYFEVDDVDTFDVANPDRQRDGAQWMNTFIVPGRRANDYVRQRVGHGRVNFVWYRSSIPGLPRRRMAVYTPAGYGTTVRRYPVLYLLHGTGGDEKSWLGLGRAREILDNLIASRRCQPMIVVMPNGIANRAATPGEDPYNITPPSSGAAVESMTGVIEKTFVGDVVNFVDSAYRTVADRQHRAIAGLSLGGLHTLFTAANNPDEFSYVGLFSAQTTNKLDNSRMIDKAQNIARQAKSLFGLFPSLGKGKAGSMVTNIDQGSLDIYDSLDVKLGRLFACKPRLFYIACGRDDFVKSLNDDLRGRLDAHRYHYVYHETDGGHTWTNWRRYLVDFLPRLFR